MVVKYSLHELIPETKSLTISLAAALLSAYSINNFVNPAEYEYLRTNVDSALGGPLPSAPSNTKVRNDTRAQHAQHKSGTISIFTDYSVLQEVFSMFTTADGSTLEWDFELTDNKETADFLFLTKNESNFLNIPSHQRINQFPYEGGFVRKDLLPLTVRRYCHDIEGNPPAWWLPCFDLATEFHLFYNEVNHRQEAQANNIWIIKPAQATRGAGHYIAMQGEDDIDASTILAQAADPVVNNTGDRVAQLLVRAPLLISKKKFDLRIFTVVKSFEPFEAYMHSWYFARIANKEYDSRSGYLQDKEVFLTVNCYDEDEEIASRQERMNSFQLEEYIAANCPAIDWIEVMVDVRKCLHELFFGLRLSIGSWPNSSAYYAVDIILDAEDDALQICPKLIEVNFLGDWHGPQTILGPSKFLEWASDIMNCMLRPEFDSTRLVKL